MRAIQVMAVAVAAALALGAAGWAGAQDERREAGAHEHGHSLLTIAIEGDQVEMELDAPGMDIVGFEYEAQSPQDLRALADAIVALQDVLALFVPPAAAGCTVVEAQVVLGGDEHEGEEAAAAEAEDEHHTEFKGHYRLTCTSPDAFRSLEFPYFERFAGAEEIEIEIIADHGQAAHEVERGTRKLDLF